MLIPYPPLAEVGSVGRAEPHGRAERPEGDEGDAEQQQLEGATLRQDVQEALPLHFRSEQGARGGGDDRARPQHQDAARGNLHILILVIQALEKQDFLTHLKLSRSRLTHQKNASSNWADHRFVMLKLNRL